MKDEVTEGCYHLQDKCRIRVTGLDTSIGQVLDGTLNFFESKGVDADLTIALGTYPYEGWQPRGFTVGDRLLYDVDSDSTTVFRRPTGSTLPMKGVEYVIQGDLRQDTRVTAFVPSIPGKMGFVRSLERGVARGSLARTFLAAIGSDYVSAELVELEAAKLRLAILEPFLFYRLPLSDSTLIHGSVVSENGSGLLFTGGGHIGKTALAFEMVKRGFAYLGDDLAMVGRDGRAMPYPEPVRIQEQHLMLFPEIQQRLQSKMGGAQKTLFNWMLGRNPGEALQLLPRMGISEVFEGAKVGEVCRIDNALLIQKGTVPQPVLEEIDVDFISRTVAAELFWEFETGHWRHNQYVYAPSCAKGGDFLAEESQHRSKVKEIIADSFHNMKTFLLKVPYEFKATDAAVYVDRILKK